MILKFLGLILLVYLIFQWFIKPSLMPPKVERGGRQEDLADLMRQFRAFQEQQGGSVNVRQDRKTSKRKAHDDDYIDYEEID